MFNMNLPPTPYGSGFDAPGALPLSPGTPFVFPYAKATSVEPGSDPRHAENSPEPGHPPRKSVRRARILAATRLMLTDAGFNGVRLNQVAELSGVTMQTIYNLAGGREQLIDVAIREYYLAHIQAAHHEAMRSGLSPLRLHMEMDSAITNHQEAYVRAVLQSIADGRCGGRLYGSVTFMIGRAYLHSLYKMQRAEMLRPGTKIHRLSCDLAEQHVAQGLLWLVGHHSKDRLHSSFCRTLKIILDGSVAEQEVAMVSRLFEGLRTHDQPRPPPKSLARA